MVSLPKNNQNFVLKKKSSLKDGEMIVIADFAETHAFILQDAAQSFHYNNDQTTQHPFVCYYRRGTELKHINLVVISDCLKHDTVEIL